MITYNVAIPIREYKGFKFTSDQGGPYYVLYFSENSNFLIDKPRLSFRQLDFRNVALPNTDMPRTHLTGEVIKEYRDNRYMVSTPDRTPKSKNVIIDSTVYISEIDKKYSPTTYQNRYGDMVFKYVYRLFANAPVGHKKIFFYSIDTKSFKSPYTKAKFYSFLQAIKKRNIFFDDLILCIISPKKVKYRILFKDKQIDYDKVLYYIRNIK